MPTSSPIFIFLHGAGTGPWIWDKVIEHLDRPAIALQLPSTEHHLSPTQCAALVVDELDALGVERVIFVLHSLSGVLARDLTGVLEDQIEHIVYVGAVIPPPGRTFLDAFSLLGKIILKILFHFKSNGLKPDDNMIRVQLCNDLSPEVADELVNRYLPEKSGLYVLPTSNRSLISPATYVKLLEDRSVNLSVQRASIARLPEPQVVELSSGHMPMLSRPEELANILSEIG